MSEKMNRRGFVAASIGAVVAAALPNSASGRRPPHPPPPPTPVPPSPTPAPPLPTSTLFRAGANTHWLHASESQRQSWLGDCRGLTVREFFSPGHPWTLIDPYVSDVKSAGATLLPILKPGGYQQGDYAAWCRAACDRYGWATFEIDNEPWNPGEWSATPAQYASNVRAVVGALKGSSALGTISADLYTSDGSDWLAPLLAADPTLWNGPNLAGWSVHPYCNPFDPATTDTSQLARKWQFRRYEDVLAMGDVYAPGGPAYLTEFGWRTTPPANQQVSESDQSLGVTEAFQTAFANPRVKMALVYKLDRPASPPSFDDGFSLYRDSANAKPALAALRPWASG